MRLDVLAIGHGCSTVVQMPDGKVICYDIGSMSNFDMARYTVGPFLRSRGIGRIDAAFISHANIDHYCGVPDLCEDFDVDTIYLSDCFPKITDSSISSPTKFLLSSLKEKKQPVKRLSCGWELTNSGNTTEKNKPQDWEIKTLWPQSPERGCQLDENDRSLVLKISVTGGSILLCGDIGAIPQQLLLESNGEELKADVLLLPHHGAVTKTLNDFVTAVGPKVIIASSGFRGERKEEKLNQALNNRRVLFTYRSGGITVLLGPDGIKTKTFHCCN